jgi:hypothetical protein
MKISRALTFTAIILVCTAQRCKRGGSDLLSRMYERAYKSETPLSPKKDPIFAPLIGSWLVGAERMMVVKKLDQNNLEFAFLSNSLSGDDVIYSGFTTTISQKKYINMLSYRDNYLFFKVFYNENSGLKLSMITNTIREKIANGTIYDYLAKNPNLADTGKVWYPITLTKYSENDRNRYMSAKYKQQITGIESYLLYEKKFPDDSSLLSIKTKALDYSIKESDSVGQLLHYAKSYPEIEKKAYKIAIQNCNTTNWCLDYVKHFPTDPAKDSIISIAFLKASTSADYENLLKMFPNDSRTAEFEFKIALSSVSAKQNMSSYDIEQFEKQYASRPNIINYFNTLKLANNIKLNKNDFVQLSYSLSASGKHKVNQLIELIKTLNTDRKNIKDVYLILNCDSLYASEKSNLINFKSGVNRCITIRKVFESKCIDVKLHCIPYLSNSFNKNSQKKASFFFTDEGLSREKRDFYADCYKVTQTSVIPNAQKELTNTEYIREEELEDYVIELTMLQIPLFLKQKPYIKTIPPNFWDGSFKKIQPSFEEIKDNILMRAAEKGMDGKKLQNFVIQ